MPDDTPPASPRRTNVYIDSWNLYYGCLKKTPYKWINVAEMVRRSMPTTYQINHIRVFTARAKARPSDPQGPVRQEMFSRALQTIPNLTMHYGSFLVSTPMMRLVTPLADGTEYLPVVKTEESGCDH